MLQYKKLAIFILLAFGATAFAHSKAEWAKSPAAFIPAGYVVVKTIGGDLNGDNQADYVFIIKGTHEDRFVNHAYRGRLDRNRRGIIVAFTKQTGYELALENLHCFSSENEDGGAYFPPQLIVSISNGNLRLHYKHGRYGYWSYRFRYRKSDFELIGYDSSQNRGPVVERSVSINLLTKNMRMRDNVNKYGEDGEKKFEEKFEETWRKFALSRPIKLSEIPDLDDFRVEEYLSLDK